MKRNGVIPFSGKECLIGGIITGSLLGAAAAFLMNSGTGKRFKGNMSHLYNGFSERVLSRHNGANKRTSKRTKLLIGSAAAILGASLLALMTTEAASGFRKRIAHDFKYLKDKSAEIVEDIEDAAEDTVETIDEKISPWVKLAQDFVTTINSNSKHSSFRSSKKRHGNSTIDTVADWAGLGIRLFQSLKK